MPVDVNASAGAAIVLTVMGYEQLLNYFFLPKANYNSPGFFPLI